MPEGCTDAETKEEIVADRGLGASVRGGVKTILLVGAIVFFLIAIAVEPEDNPLDWLALGLAFLTAGMLSDSLDLNLRKKWE
jgi:hypothetical protein